MNRIAIITLYGETNYGNRLQNYAIYRYLTEMGFSCETLVLQKPQTLNAKLKNAVRRLLCKTIVKNKDQNRVNSFSRFTKKYIPTRKVSSGYDLEKLSQEYDYFVVGSDQVWNPCFGGFSGYFDEMFLTFVPKEKRVCLSPSFGVSSIPEEWKETFANALNGFDQISVREKDGVHIIKELTGKSATCLIDPTMLFNGDDWNLLANIPKESNYIFTYFLGECPEGMLPKDKKIVDVLDKTSGKYYAYNPSDFLGYIRNADAVYTDSFHACVFAILFDRPFCVLERVDGYNSMSSRIQSLFEEFEIEYDLSSPRLVKVDTTIRDRILAERRTDVKHFLEKQLSMGDK